MAETTDVVVAIKVGDDAPGEASFQTVPTHVDDWLERIMPHTAEGNPGEVYARWWLEQRRYKASAEALYLPITQNFLLFCDYGGQRWRVTGASRLGDVWLAKDPHREGGYDKRVDVTLCSGWSNRYGDEYTPMPPMRPEERDELELLRNLVELAQQDNEITESPWWMIIDPRGMIHSASQIESRITGPFFCREDAEAHIKARRYAFYKQPVVWCLSGYWSHRYKGLLRGIRTAASGLTATQKRVAKWARKTFPHSTTESRLWHLLQEYKELLDDPTNVEEMADMALILCHMAEEAGKDLGVAMREKLEVNIWDRKWSDPDAEGVCHHV